jgi:hypothetical protein
MECGRVPPHATFAKGCQLRGGCQSGKGEYTAQRKELHEKLGNFKKAWGSAWGDLNTSLGNRHNMVHELLDQLTSEADLRLS